MISILENRKNVTILTFQNCVFFHDWLYVMVSRMSRSNSMVSRRAKLPEIILGTKKLRFQFCPKSILTENKENIMLKSSN